jgi:hypothetical protein
LFISQETPQGGAKGDIVMIIASIENGLVSVGSKLTANAGTIWLIVGGVATIIIGFSVVMVAVGFFRKVDGIDKSKRGVGVGGRHASGEVSAKERRRARSFWADVLRKKPDDDIPFLNFPAS